MTRPATEIVHRGASAVRRSGLWWGVGIVALAVVTAAFWPSLEGSDALQNFDDMKGLLEAFGAQNIATPAGYLDGQMYALMLPLLLSGLTIAVVSALTSGDEDAGRLEFLHALPVSRRTVWLGRLAAGMLVLAAIALITMVVMVVLRPVFSLDEVPAGRLVGATLGCALLGAFHGTIAYAVGGFGSTRGRAVGIAVFVLVLGYIVSYLVPLADALTWARRFSPWYWAIGEQPVSDGVQPAWQLLLVAVSCMLVVVGTLAMERRDIRNA